MKPAATLLLLLAVVHESAWLFVPPEWNLARDVRDVTQWGLVAGFCWLVHVLAHDRFTSAVCAAVAVMSSTTAGCAAWWLFDRSVSQCSSGHQAPLMLLSAIAALAVFWGCDGPEH